MFVSKEIIVKLDDSDIEFLFNWMGAFRVAKYLVFGTDELVCMALFEKHEASFKKRKAIKLRLKPFQASALERCLLTFCNAVENEVECSYMWAVGMELVRKIETNKPYILW